EPLYILPGQRKRELPGAALSFFQFARSRRAGGGEPKRLLAKICLRKAFVSQAAQSRLSATFSGVRGRRAQVVLQADIRGEKSLLKDRGFRVKARTIRQVGQNSRA